jgi:hypothetical protein
MAALLIIRLKDRCSHIRQRASDQGVRVSRRIKGRNSGRVTLIEMNEMSSL